MQSWDKGSVRCGLSENGSPRKERRDIMAIVIMSKSNVYITVDKEGKLKKTLYKEEAMDFGILQKAIDFIYQNPDETTGFYVFDTVTERICYWWKVKKDKKKRKIYPHSIRKMIYDNADGRCNLCGRKIMFKSMTLDHINPLSMGGEDRVSNLACTCKACNLFKRNMLPDDFFERIALIYLYQMEKKYSEKWRWKVIQKLLKGMT